MTFSPLPPSGMPASSPTTSRHPWRPLERDAAQGQETYPFHNFWSAGGGLDEVLFALPSREHADVLVDGFFTYVDPSYPIIPEGVFRSRFEEFWALAPNDRYAAKSAPRLGNIRLTFAGVGSTRPGLRFNSLCLLRATYLCKTPP